MAVEDIISTALAEVPKCLACGVVDMGSGMLLGVKTTESHPQEVLDTVAAATKELFEGDMVVTIENLFKKSRGVESDERYFQEMLVSSTNLWHFFGRMKSSPTTVVCMVCRGDANLGMLTMKARGIVQTGTI